MKELTVELLKKARELISEPDRWTKLAGARDAHGYPTDPVPGNDYAFQPVCFCTAGALWHCAGEAGGADSSRAMQELLITATGREDENIRLFQWNDHPLTTHDDVMSLFDRTIQRLESEV